MTCSTALAKHLSIVWLLLLLGCQYEPDGEFFKDIDDSRVSRPSIQLKDALGVIPLNEKTSFSYDIVTSRAHFRTEVFFDGKTIDYTDKDYGDGYFILDPKDYEEGQYSLRIVTAVGSGTGSLADKVDAEYIQSERTWEVIIERPEPVNVKSVSIDSGSIRLEWEAYRPLQLEKFSHYEISYDGVYGGILARITDPNTTVTYDTLFFSGHRSYQVNVRTENHVARGEEFSYSYPHPPYEPNLEAELSSDTLKMHWNRPTLYNNIKQFEVSFCCGEGENYIRAHTDDTHFVAPVSMKFGQAALASLTVRSNYSDHFRFYENKYYGKELFIGDSADLGNSLLFSTATQSYYSSTYKNNSYGGRLFSKRYNADLTEQDRDTFRQFWSYNTKHAMSYDGKIAYEYDVFNDNITELNVSTLEEAATYSAQELFGSNDATGASNVFIANNHVVALTSYKQRSFVFDMENATLLKEFAAPEKLLLSPSGEFLMAADTLYQRSGSDYVPISVLDGARSAYIGFSSVLPNHLVIGQSSTIKVYDCQTATLVSSLDLPTEVDYFSIDPFTTLVGGYKHNTEKYYVTDLMNESVKTVDIFANYHDSRFDYNYFLLNGNLFSKEGFYLKLIE